MYILASHDIALAYARLGSDADWGRGLSQPLRLPRREANVWALGEAIAWLVTLGYCLAALRF